MNVWTFIQDQLLGMKWLNQLIGQGLSALGLDVTGRIGGSVQFFLYDTIKIMVLLGFLILVISYIQSYFPPERTKRILGRFHGIGANCIAALLGTVTPFCSCSSIPLFIGFTSAGLPLGVTFSFLISSPMVDLGSLVLLMSIFGWKVAVLYVVLGLAIAVAGGTLIEKLHLENQVEEFIRRGKAVDLPQEELTVKDRIMDDRVFDSCFAQVDEKSYLAAKQARSMGLNILAHELSHVEFAIRVKRPESERSLHSGLIQHGFILLDEYFACRKATAFSKYSLADDDEKFIQDLERQTEEDRWAYKTGKIDLNHFCSLFHSHTEMTMIRLASIIGANHSMNSDQLPFPNTKVGRYAHVLSEEFDLLYASILSGANVSISEEVINAIHSYFVDMGVRIEDTTQGLYYHVPD